PMTWMHCLLTGFAPFAHRHQARSSSRNALSGHRYPNSSCPLHSHFGIPFAHTKSARVIEVKVDGEVMEGLVHCSKVRYAIIQTSSKKDHPERVVLAYRDENCLRDLIVAASIVGP